jgi:glutamyl-tRNA synthetase
MERTRTRFAPSPTGSMHIGNVRTALYAYLLAKKDDGDFILRIEDTDQKRFVEGATEIIYNTLTDLGMIWDEGPDKGGDYGPYVQSERKNSYRKYADKLVEEGKAYYCFCKKTEEDEEVETYKVVDPCRDLPYAETRPRVEAGEEHVIRFKAPMEGTTVFEDLIYGEISVPNEEIEDLIMIKSDGMPTYNFANIVDDTEMAISHIVRGNEYVSSTPKYVLMYEALGWEVPKFIHVPLILKDKESGKKLSKRDGDATIAQLKSKGYLNEAIINMLALTGWSPAEEREIYSIEELIEHFDPTRIGRGNAIFDVDKLNWLNAHYIKELDDEALFTFLKPFVDETYENHGRTDEFLKGLFVLLKDRLSKGIDIVEESKLFFNDGLEVVGEAREFISQEGVKETLTAFKSLLEASETFDADTIKSLMKQAGKDAGVKGKMLFMPCRIATTGAMHGPDLPKALSLLGKDVVVSRLVSVIESLD